jgi:hypothetical protein
MAEPDGQLGRILERVDGLREDVTEIKNEMARKDDVNGLEGQLRMLREDHEARLRQVETKTTCLEERQSTLTRVLAGLSILASGIAAFLGVRL